MIALLPIKCRRKKTRFCDRRLTTPIGELIITLRAFPIEILIDKAKESINENITIENFYS